MSLWRMFTRRRIIATTVAGLSTCIGYGIILSNTPPRQINPQDIIQDGGKYITTTDNRIVEYFVCGSTQQDASVIIDIAGGLSTGKLHTKHPRLSKFYTQNNIKSISITLPGWGYSSLNPNRKYVDWPRTDLEPILLAENVDKFAVSGVSLGAPHAMAAAYHFGPKNRIYSLGVRVPFLSMDISKEYGLPAGQPSLPSDVIFNKTWYSWFIHLSFNLFSKMISKPSILQYMIFPSKLSTEYPILTELITEDIIRGQSHSSYHGIMQCMAYDTILDWGFDVKSIKNIPKVTVWYASDDDDCPPSHGKWLAEWFSERKDVDLNVKVFDGYGHVGGALIDYVEYAKTLLI